jgi:hypothetical protein
MCDGGRAALGGGRSLDPASPAADLGVACQACLTTRDVLTRGEAQVPEPADGQHFPDAASRPATEGASPSPAGHPPARSRVVNGPVDDARALRHVAELEEMVARSHERAAELYESWLRQPRDDRRLALERRARMHRELAAAGRSVERLAERTLNGFEARVEAGTPPTHGKAGALVTLAALERLRVLITQRIEQLVATNRREGATWAEIAAVLKVTRQSAHQRYR